MCAAVAHSVNVDFQQFFLSKQSRLHIHICTNYVSIGGSRLVKSSSILETKLYLHMIVQSVIASAMNSNWFIML